jgi:hypothetical protein
MTRPPRCPRTAAPRCARRSRRATGRDRPAAVGRRAAMVFHDDTLGPPDRQKGPVHRFPASSCRIRLLRGGRDRIPTLPELLDRRGRVPLLLEIKDQDRRDGHGRPWNAPPLPALARYAGPVAVMSFNPRMRGAAGRDGPRRAARPDHLGLRRREGRCPEALRAHLRGSRISTRSAPASSATKPPICTARASRN